MQHQPRSAVHSMSRSLRAPPEHGNGEHPEEFSIRRELEAQGVNEKKNFSEQQRSVRLLLVDNYDSFTYNLYQHLSELSAEVHVRRNDQFALADVVAMDVDGIVISPGPGRPADAGRTPELIETFAETHPILGVCLGHQAIGEVFGGRVVRAPRILHGKVSTIYHDGRTIYRDLSNPLVATRYHSLVIDAASVPSCLDVSARTSDGVIMGVRHRTMPVEGVQFHPESALTPDGKRLLGNFLALVRRKSHGDS